MFIIAALESRQLICLLILLWILNCDYSFSLLYNQEIKPVKEKDIKNNVKIIRRGIYNRCIN